MNKKLSVGIAIVFSLFLAVWGFVTHYFSGKILYPFWHKPGLTKECVQLTLDSSPELCTNNPESAIKQKFESFELDSQYGKVSGWFFPTEEPTNSVVIFVHGAGSDRREGYKLVPFLLKAGYSVYLFDTINHGRSANNGKGVSYGYRESEALRVVLEDAEKKFSNIFIITNSAGGSALALAKKYWEGKVKALVVENPPYSLERLIRENPTAQSFPDWYIGLVLWYTSLRGDFDVKAIQPGEIAKEFPDIPIFVCHGTKDSTVPFQHGVDFYNNLKSTQKIFFEAKDTEHGRVWNKYPEEYEKFTLETFQKGIK